MSPVGLGELLSGLPANIDPDLLVGFDTSDDAAVYRVNGEQAFAVALNRRLEGKTEKQKNPHPEGSLAWLAWIVARLGGWSGYQRYGPPGPKTIAHGWDQFKTMSQGWNLRQNV